MMPRVTQIASFDWLWGPYACIGALKEDFDVLTSRALWLGHNSEKCEIVKPTVFTCKTFNRTLLFGWKLSGRWMSQWQSPMNGSSCSKHTSSAEQSQLCALNYCGHSFDINENHSAFSNLYTRYYKHICRWQKRSVYVVVMVTRTNVWKWRRLDHGGRFKGHLPPIFKIHPFV